MADDTFTPAITGFGGQALAPGDPRLVQAAYLRMMQQRNRQQKPLSSYYHPLAAVGDIAQELGDQAQMNRLMQGMQQQNAAAATTVPGLPGADSGGGGGGTPSMPPPAMPSPAMPQASPATPTAAVPPASSPRMAIPSARADPDFNKSLDIAREVINSGPPPPGGATMNGRPGASYSEIMGGPPGDGAAPAASSPVGAPPSAGVPPSSAAGLPADPRARQEFQAAQERAIRLKSFPYGSPEHQEGIKLEEELQKQRMAPSKEVTDPRTGEIQRYDPLTGGHSSGLPKALTPGEGEAMGSELKSAHTTLTGLRGLGVTGSNIEPYTAAAVKIAGELTQTGFLSPDTQLMVERLKKQFGMSDSATPLAVLGQIRNTVLNGMQSGAKSFSTEGGEAARLFTTEVETMKGELPPVNAPKEEQLPGWRSVHRRAVKWGDDAQYFNQWARSQPNGLPTSEIHNEIIKRNRAFKPYDEGDLKPSPGPPGPLPQQGSAPAPGMPQPPAPPPTNFVNRFSAAYGAPAPPPPGGSPTGAPGQAAGNPIAQALMAGDNPGALTSKDYPPIGPAKGPMLGAAAAGAAGGLLGGPALLRAAPLALRGLNHPVGQAAERGTLMYYLLQQLMGGAH